MANATETIYGNTSGLKANQLKTLQKLYTQRLPGDSLVTAEFAQRLGASSNELQQPLCVYVNRRGQVVRVGVGTPNQTQIPPLELPRQSAERLSGIRCLATQLKDAPPSTADLTAMVLQRLDALVLLSVTGQGFERRGGGATGYVGSTYLSYPIPQADPGETEAPAYWHVSPAQSLDALSKLDFPAWVEELEANFQHEHSTAQEIATNNDRALLVGLLTDRHNEQQFQYSLAELQRLVESAGGQVLAVVQQKRDRLDPKTVVGEGKVQEIALTARTLGANLVVFDRQISPSQVRNLEERIGVRVVDRAEVILDIFAQRAQSQAGKLQVELAQLAYMMPRLAGRGATLSRLGGGIGTRGPGETQLETERRTIQGRITRLQHQVDDLQAHRSRLRQQRQHQEVPTIALVGYTNAGKSTLLNVLTQSEVYTADRLFATLDPTTRRLRLPEGETILLTDTVGFIHELPPPLVNAFRATLEEVSEADALLHVVDLSYPDWQSHVESVKKLLGELPIQPGPSLLVFNKIDRVPSRELDQVRSEFKNAVFVSAIQRQGLDEVYAALARLAKDNTRKDKPKISGQTDSQPEGADWSKIKTDDRSMTEPDSIDSPTGLPDSSL
ncbi:GTPase HflX [Leptolyngbya sp. FACHB-261]|uniref:GTPase HflX n=1 Tax=Leptolyngbya sp. FACHB-261 TaxID=2692806 RepID=UPI00168914B7|nr:GTPase HflX [Leptolyngbya sp. FACHB-261]MBD2100296.1 GTPase HflX [Leptolyngbya sp. FACHB-261]